MKSLVWVAGAFLMSVMLSGCPPIEQGMVTITNNSSEEVSVRVGTQSYSGAPFVPGRTFRFAVNRSYLPAALVVQTASGRVVYERPVTWSDVSGQTVQITILNQ